MCNVCGCNDGNVRLESSYHGHHDHGSDHLHTRNNFHHHHGHDDDLHFGRGPAHNHVEGFSQRDRVEIEESTLSLPHAWLSHATLQPPCLELTRAEPNTRTALNQSRSVTEREVLGPRPEIEDAKATYPAGGPKHFGPVVSMLPLRTGPEVTPLVKPAPGEKAGEP